MTDDLMRYDRLVDDSLRQVVRAALLQAASEEGLPGEHHYFITFRTHYPGVVMPGYLLEMYPDNMTIVLKTKFWDLEVEADHFAVGLSFQQKPERLTIPLASVTRFVDPAVDFDLRFRVEIPETPKPEERPAPTDELPERREGEAEVVSLDAFRKKS